MITTHKGCEGGYSTTISLRVQPDVLACGSGCEPYLQWSLKIVYQHTVVVDILNTMIVIVEAVVGYDEVTL